MRHQVFMTLILAAAVSVTALAASADGTRSAMPGFAALDRNGDGALTQAELASARTAWFATADGNGDGLLSAEELEAAHSARAGDRAARMIDRMDRDGDGQLSQAELIRRGGDGRGPVALFERLDTDDSGTLSQDEFAEARKHMRGGHGHGQRDAD
jgi:hypothetical protein